MEFTKENWENAPEGATLEWQVVGFGWEPAYFVGWLRNGRAVIETDSVGLTTTRVEDLRITLPKRKVTVQLWRDNTGSGEMLFAVVTPASWGVSGTLLGEHTFEIGGE